MIAGLKGETVEIGEKSAVLNVAGVGYRIFTTTSNLQSLHLGQGTFFHTYLAVRENALDLFGFQKKEELDFFELLITIPGIGPKSALAILNIASIPALRSAIISGDTAYLTKVSGIGRKTAEKIVLELREKIDAHSADDSPSLKEESDALLALMSLGYGERESRQALKEISKPGSKTTEIVKEALKFLGNGK